MAAHTSSVLFGLRTQSAGCERRGMLGTARVPQLGGARVERAISNSDTAGFAGFCVKPLAQMAPVRVNRTTWREELHGDFVHGPEHLEFTTP